MICQLEARNVIVFYFYYNINKHKTNIFTKKKKLNPTIRTSVGRTITYLFPVIMGFMDLQDFFIKSGPTINI